METTKKITLKDLLPLIDDAWVDVFQWDDEKCERVLLHKTDMTSPPMSDSLLAREVDAITPGEEEDRDEDGYTELVLIVTVKPSQD